MLSKTTPKVNTFLKKPKKKIEILSNEEHTIVLKDINIDEINKKYQLVSNSSIQQSSPKSFETSNNSIQRLNDGSISSSKPIVKDIVEKSIPIKSKMFSVVDESAVKRTANSSSDKILSDFINSNESKFKKSSKMYDMNTLTSDLEKLGLANREIIQTDIFFKDNLGKEIKMLIYGTNEYIKRDIVEAKCWWCRHTFPKEWHPLGMPLKYNKTNNEFICEGIFCSFNCIMAHLHSCDHQSIKYRDCGQLVTLLYREVVGKICWTEKLIPAPSWKNLKEYGGKLTIEQFRETFNKLQIMERMQIKSAISFSTLHTINLVEKVN
jgi:hypothetical protein